MLVAPEARLGRRHPRDRKGRLDGPVLAPAPPALGICGDRPPEAHVVAPGVTDEAVDGSGLGRGRLPARRERRSFQGRDVAPAAARRLGRESPGRGCSPVGQRRRTGQGALPVHHPPPGSVGKALHVADPGRDVPMHRMGDFVERLVMAKRAGLGPAVAIGADHFRSGMSPGRQSGVARSRETVAGCHEHRRPPSGCQKGHALHVTSLEDREDPDGCSVPHRSLPVYGGFPDRRQRSGRPYSVG